MSFIKNQKISKVTFINHFSEQTHSWRSFLHVSTRPCFPTQNPFQVNHNHIIETHVVSVTSKDYHLAVVDLAGMPIPGFWLFLSPSYRFLLRSHWVSSIIHSIEPARILHQCSQNRIIQRLESLTQVDINLMSVLRCQSMVFHVLPCLLL